MKYSKLSKEELESIAGGVTHYYSGGEIEDPETGEKIHVGEDHYLFNAKELEFLSNKGYKANAHEDEPGKFHSMYVTTPEGYDASPEEVINIMREGGFQINLY